MLGYAIGRVNSMAVATIPTSFNNLFDGSYGGGRVYYKALSTYSSGVACSVVSNILVLVMLVQLVKISKRYEAHATFPAVREVTTLFVACAPSTPTSPGTLGTSCGPSSSTSLASEPNGTRERPSA